MKLRRLSTPGGLLRSGKPQRTRHRPRPSHEGVSLVEVLIAMALVAVLMSLAVPMAKSLQARRAVDAALGLLTSDFSLARAEAIRRGHFVIICPTDDGTACADKDDWQKGWLLLEQVKAKTGSAPTTFPIRVQGPLPGIASLEVNLGLKQKQFRFGPTGIGVSASGNIVLVPAADTSARRLLCISPSGTQELRDPGTKSCS